MTDSAAIDAGMLSFYARLTAASPPESVNWPLPQQRAGWDEVCRAFRAARPPGLSVQDHHVERSDGGRVPVRVYRPEGSERLPGLIYFHGGGWVLGSLETHDDMCAELAALAKAVVVAVDYRLAPEHRHPAQFEDNMAVLGWMRGGGAAEIGLDTSRIIAAGDSAGGQMSASLAISLRDAGARQLQGLLLIYPVLGGDVDTASYMRNAQAPCLTRADMIYYLESFLGPRGAPGWRDPRALPLVAEDYAGLPPCFITAAAHDPLHDDAVIFAERLTAAAVPVRLRHEPALTHSYMRARHVCAPAMAGFRAIATAARSLAHDGALP